MGSSKAKNSKSTIQDVTGVPKRDIQHSQRSRSNAAGNRSMFIEMTGVNLHRSILDQRLRYANKAMDYTRQQIPQAGNIERQSVEAEKQRAIEYNIADMARDDIKNLNGPLKELDRGLQGFDKLKKFSMIGASAEEQRAGNCMEMSLVTMNYFGKKVEKYKNKLAQDNLPTVKRDHFQAKLAALNQVSLQFADNSSNTRENHMWVRLGPENGGNTVIADAWGKGNAVKQENYLARDIFNVQVDQQNIITSHSPGEIPFNHDTLQTLHNNIETLRSNADFKHSLSENKNTAQLRQHRGWSSYTFVRAQNQHKNEK